MNIPNSSQLYQAVLKKKALYTDFGEIDHGKPFMPEYLTQLYHTSAYTLLNQQQKLRYNQLFAVRSIEQLMTLEARFIALVLERTKKSVAVKYNDELKYCMQEMAVEEKQHYRMFHSINKLAEPEIYRHNEMYFAKMSLFERTVLTTLTRTPGITIFLLWILLILEEFSTCISKQMIRVTDNKPGILEPNFVKVHHEHLKDESRHVAICANLLAKLISNASQTTIDLNTFILKQFMRDYMTPKRGGLRVINKLVEEFPELQLHKQKIVAAIRDQKQDKVIFDSLKNPKRMPFSHKLFEQHPEFCFYKQARA